MKKIITCLIILCWTGISVAEENVPLFNDPMPDIPNIGRTADPLDKLLLTPSPLPEVEVDLSNKKATQPQPKVEPKKEEKPAAPVNTDIARSTPVSLKKEMGIVQIKRTQTETTDEALSVSTPEPQPEAVPVVIPEPIAESEPMIQNREELESLFGKTHDVRGFEIAGMALGMTPDEILDSARMMGFKRTEVRYGIPMFRSAFYEQNCRDKRVSLLSEVRHCIERQADRDGVKYVSSMTFKKPATREYLRVLFTTHATDNQAFKIYYESEGDNSLTLTQRNLAKQLRRKDMFWKMMFDTYGLPDDSEQIVWGDPQKAYMQATMNGSSYNAYIVMEDKEIQDEDYFSAEDESKELRYRNPFTFIADYEGE